MMVLMLILVMIVVVMVFMLVIVLIVVIMVMMVMMALTFLIVTLSIGMCAVDYRAVLSYSLVAAVVMMMMVMMMLLLHYKLKEFSFQIIITLESIKDFFSCNISKRCCDNSCLLVVLTDKLYSGFNLGLISLAPGLPTRCSP